MTRTHSRHVTQQIMSSTMSSAEKSDALAREMAKSIHVSFTVAELVAMRNALHLLVQKEHAPELWTALDKLRNYTILEPAHD